MFGFDPFAQIKKRTNEWGRRRREFFNNINFGNENNNGWGNNNNNNNGWGNNNNNNNNGWGNDNGWGNNNNNNNNNGWGNNNNNNNGWGNENNNNGWGNNNNNNNNGWGNQGGNGGNQGGQGGSIWGNLNGMEWINEMQKHQGNITPFQINDIKKFVENQIVLIEPSPHKQKLEELKKNGQTFKDDRFPPNQQSLSGQWGFCKEWQEIKWVPISQGLPNSKIFQGKIEPGDIAQGYLGDCYFLAALAALAERPDRIFDLFLLNEVNEQKYYSVKMLYKGKWLTIDMDEYVPFLYGKPAFTKAKDNQLWVVLLQKAWAKLYTSYKRIEAGYPEEGLHDLTGAPVRQIALQGATFDKQKQWRYLVDASQRQYAMVSSSQPGSDTNKSVSGVVQGHAYTFLNATTLNFQGQQHRVVQLRNPWGKGQFKGKWSDNDPNWQYVSPEEKARIGYTNVEDGTFFMTWDDYCKEFRALTVCEIDDNASYIYKSYKDPQNKGCYFRVTIHKSGNYSFHVDKTPERSLEDSRQNQFTYPLAEIQLGQLNGNSVFGKRGTNSRKRTLYYDIDLETGVYVVFVRVHYDKQFEKDFDVNLAIYAEFPCEITLASAGEADIFAGRNVDWSGQETKASGAWNDLAGYGVLENQINGGWQNNNGGWGEQQGNNGWGQQNNNNGGWGNQSNNNNGGWGIQPPSNNNGWGIEQQNNNNNSGWETSNNQGNNNGWGIQPNQGNNGWGNQGNNGHGNNGWGNSSGHGHGNKHGWGNQGNNNGW